MQRGGMESYTELFEYASQESKLGEEFFFERMKTLRDSVDERRFQIRKRRIVSAHVLREIEQDKRDRERRLNSLTAAYSAERMALLKSIDSLQKEARSEEIRRMRDIAQWSKEAREKLEEYQGMEQLFSAMAVSKGRENV
jgi:hypothetical protein